MKESINVWGIKEYEGDGTTCPIVPASLPLYKKVVYLKHANPMDFDSCGGHRTRHRLHRLTAALGRCRHYGVLDVVVGSSAQHNRAANTLAVGPGDRNLDPGLCRCPVGISLFHCNADRPRFSPCRGVFGGGDTSSSVRRMTSDN